MTIPAAPMPVEVVKPRRWFGIALVATLLLTAAIIALLFTRKGDVTVPPPSTTTVAVDTTPTSPPPVVVVEKGQLLINALPWGEVTSVKNAEGAEQLAGSTTTPIVLSLPVGAYKVQLTNPNSKRSVVLDATVSANATSRCEAELDRVDADDYVKGIGL